jgi:flavin-dependent dehydrogenase
MDQKISTQEAMPVIIGSSMTGMVISRMLSRKKIKHLAIGSRPHPSRPRLGESINGEGSLDLEELFPEFSQYYFPKKNIVFYTGNLVSRCDLDTSKNSIFATFFKLSGFNAFKHLLHVDRLGFDLELFKSITQDEYCLFLEKKVINIIYDRDHDEIQAIFLDDGSKIHTSFVFDATNHARLLPKKLEIPCHFFGEPQRVIFTHYNCSNPQVHSLSHQEKVTSWSHSTNLLKLCQEIDGINGMAWCIPLGGYISVGMSTSAELYNKISNQEAIALLDRAYKRRGIDYRQDYAQETEIVSIRNQYFKHEYAGGSNWLLAGGTYSQVWFPTGSGVATSLYTARFAERFLTSPQKMRQQYENFMGQFWLSHGIHDQIITDDLRTLTYQKMYHYTDSLLTATILRICTYAQSRNHSLGGLFAKLVKFLIEIKVLRIKFFCKILESDLDHQTEDIHTEKLTYL